jgi:hypothetical protein
MTLPGPWMMGRAGNQVHVPSGFCWMRPPWGASGRVAAATDAEGEAPAVLSAGEADALAFAAAGDGEGPTSTVGAAGGWEGLLSQPAAKVTTKDAARAFFLALMGGTIHRYGVTVTVTEPAPGALWMSSLPGTEVSSQQPSLSVTVCPCG